MRTTPDGDYHAVCPRDVLLGRAIKLSRKLEDNLERLHDFEEDVNLAMVEQDQAKIVAQWRAKWLAQVFVDMVPRTKWCQASRDLQVGDLGLVRYDSKFGDDMWRLAKIVAADPDQDGLVRTITVAFRPRHKRDVGKKYRAKIPVELTIGVQRFAVMLPVEEQTAPQDDLVEKPTLPLPPVTSAMTVN